MTPCSSLTYHLWFPSVWLKSPGLSHYWVCPSSKFTPFPGTESTSCNPFLCSDIPKLFTLRLWSEAKQSLRPGGAGRGHLSGWSLECSVFLGTTVPAPHSSELRSGRSGVWVRGAAWKPGAAQQVARGGEQREQHRTQFCWGCCGRQKSHGSGCSGEWIHSAKEIRWISRPGFKSVNPLIKNSQRSSLEH